MWEIGTVEGGGEEGSREWCVEGDRGRHGWWGEGGRSDTEKDMATPNLLAPASVFTGKEI